MRNFNWNFTCSTLASLCRWRHKQIPPPDAAASARIFISHTSLQPSPRYNIWRFWLSPPRPAQAICCQGCAHHAHTRSGRDRLHQGAAGVGRLAEGTKNISIYLPSCIYLVVICRIKIMLILPYLCIHAVTYIWLTYRVPWVSSS